MGYKILVIDDDTECADNVASILKLAHYEVVSAHDGREGLALIEKLRPDLILCDVVMPGLDGYGVLYIVRNNPATEKIPFIFLSGKSGREDFRTGMTLGADDYVTKPFDGIELLRVVELRLKRTDAGARQPADLSEPVATKANVPALEGLCANRQIRTFRKREILFMEGQTPNELYFIRKGLIKTYKVNYERKELITGIYGTGEFLGYIPLLENQSYGENAEAIEPGSLAVIPKADFLSLLYSSKEVGSTFISLLTTGYKDLENRLIEIAYLSVRQRVASQLIRLDELSKRGGDNDVITICRRDFSNIVGAATESLNRTLSDFKEENLIEILDSGVRVLNRPKLEKVMHM